MKDDKFAFLGVCQLENGQKSESHQSSCSPFVTPMMVLYRKRANNLGVKWST